MEAPFFPTGGTQKARAVLQVLGENGPIFNPRRIRYMSLEGGGAPSVPALPLSLPGLSVAMSGLNLLASVGNLVMSAVILGEIKAIHRKLDLLLAGQARIEAKLEVLDAILREVLKKVDRIDTNVAENGLARALDHLLKKAIAGREVDLVELSRLHDDLVKFTGSVDGWGLGAAPGLRLSSDVRDRLESVFAMISGVRTFVVASHNVACDGNPARVVACDPVRDYLPSAPMSARAAIEFRNRFEYLARRMAGLDGEDYQEYCGSLVGEVSQAFECAVGESNRAILSRVRERHPDEEGLRWQGRQAAAEAAATLLANRGHGADDRAMVLTSGDEASSRIAAFCHPADDEMPEEFLPAWLWRTDAGLIWRLLAETRGLKEGYQVFPTLSNQTLTPLPSTVLGGEFSIDLSKLPGVP